MGATTLGLSVIRNAFLVSALMLAVGSPTYAPAAVSTKHCDPVRVTYASTWAGLPGTVTSGVGSLERRGYDFIMGQRAYPGNSVRRLAASLDTGAHASPPKLQFGATFLKRYAGRALSWSFQDDVRRKEAHATYDAMFEDERRFNRFLAHVGWGALVRTDDYPDVSVTVLCGDRRSLKAASTSQAPYGVPWTISGSSGTYTTANIEIGRSLADILGDQDVNHARLSDDGIAEAYAEFVLAEFTATVPAPDSLDRFPTLKAYLLAHGFTYSPDVLQPDGERWDYHDVTSDQQPGFGFYGAINDGNETEEAQLLVDGSHRILERLRLFPWLRKALSAPNQRGYAIAPENHSYQPGDDIAALRKAGRSSSADLLAADAHVAIAISLYRNEPSSLMAESSEWYLLPDGRLLLARYEENALSILGFEEGSFGPLNYGHAVGGQVFSPDGTWRLP